MALKGYVARTASEEFEGAEGFPKPSPFVCDEGVMKYRTLDILVGVAAFSLNLSSVAVAKVTCKDVDTALTSERKATYSKLVANSLDSKVSASKVEIQAYMEASSWSVVYAGVPVADPGYFFFRSVNGKPEFKEVWGGMADESETPELVRWAEKLGAPKSVAECFARNAVSD